MLYGDESFVEVPADFDLDDVSAEQLRLLFERARPLTHFDSTPDHNSIIDTSCRINEGLRSHRVDRDRLIEINDALFRTPVAIRNWQADVISFQFVSTVQRSEYLGTRKNAHYLGPALIVSVLPAKEITYRVPKINVYIRHVAVHTTLSTLMQQTREPRGAYPNWLLERIEGVDNKPHQAVFFLEDVHRDLTWSCFNLPVAGSLIGRWMSAKFDELLCVGLQILKNSRDLADGDLCDGALPYAERIRRARAILSLEYAQPPSLPKLAQRLGISETRLKSGFKSMNGTTIMQYSVSKRLEAAMLLLKENRYSISEIGSIVGYEDHSAFSRAFRRFSGRSPKDWRRSQQRG